MTIIIHNLKFSRDQSVVCGQGQGKYSAINTCRLLTKLEINHSSSACRGFSFITYELSRKGWLSQCGWSLKAECTAIDGCALTPSSV